MKVAEKRTETRGRPSKKPRNLFLAVRRYLKQSQDVFKDGKLFKINLPSVEGFAEYFGVHRDTLYVWARSDNNAANALREIKSDQEKRLIICGLYNIYKTPFVVWMLKANHGYGVKKKERRRIAIEHEFVRWMYASVDQEEDEEVALSSTS